MKNSFKQFIPFVGLFILIGLRCRKTNEDILSPNIVIPSQKTASRNIIERFDSYIAQSWYSLLLKMVIETPGHTPPIAARSLGYTGIALYESLVGEMKDNNSLVGQLNGLTIMPKHQYGNSYLAPITANAALARIIKYLFKNASPSNLGKIEALELANDNIYSKHYSEKLIERSVDYGRAVADAVFNWSVTDGGNQAYLHNFPTDYIPPAGLDKWIPTAPAKLPAMLPYWGNNRPMIVADAAGSVDPPAPPAFSTTPGSPFHNAALEVYNISTRLSAAQKIIASYWADAGATFTPPGHNIAITLQLIRDDHLNLYEAAVLLAKVGIALNDGGIVCWRAKYHTNLLRPISFIQTYIDPTFTTHIPTPPFPSYTSGHSTFSAAVAGILSANVGNDVSFIDSTKMADGFSPRSFSSFNAYAQEAAISRLYGGIHYGFDNENGFACGQLIARNVEQLKW